MQAQDYLRDLCQAYATERVDRRTYIRERRRLIDEAVAGTASAPPAIPKAFDSTTVTDLDASDLQMESTMEIPHRPGDED